MLNEVGVSILPGPAKDAPILENQPNGPDAILRVLDSLSLVGA